MMHPVYIRSAAAISPQHTFNGTTFLCPVESSNNGMLFVVDAEYSKYISPVAIRRMSRMIKIGISTGMQCLQDAGITQPDAIITGTGRGSMSDMERFITDMLELEEQALNPTYFIQSTYNSINGWIALQTKCSGYNQTFVNRGFSLELSLLDAQLLLQDKTEPSYALVGCFDELTPDYFKTKVKIGYWKKQIPNSLELLKHSDTPGSIGGEGAAFFTITNEKKDSLCAVVATSMVQEPDPTNLPAHIEDMLNKSGLSLKDIDVLLCGMSGDARHQPVYDTVINTLSGNTSVAAFKHLCGEYDTSSGFAVWAATRIFSEQQIPELMLVQKGTSGNIRNILVLNHYVFGSVSMVLLQRDN